MHVLEGQGVIQLIDFTGSDKTIVNAARVSYDADTTDEFIARDTKLIAYLIDNMHTSPFEHVTFTFHVKAPIYIARQWMRHRTWSFNEVSARYTSQEETKAYLPRVYRSQAKDNKQMSGIALEASVNDKAREIMDLVTSNAIDMYAELLRLGVAREMARAILPQAMFTRFYATVDLHNLMHFITLRAHHHAQNEIREYARAMFKHMRTVTPVTAALYRERRPYLDLPDE